MSLLRESNMVSVSGINNASVSLDAASVGAAAHASLQRASAAAVIGVTSRGLFLLMPDLHILYVSAEQFHGPMTINLARSHPRLRAVSAGAAVRLSTTRLFFPAIALEISLPADVVWQAPLPVGVFRPRVEQLAALDSIARAVLSHRDNTYRAAWLPRLLDMTDASTLSAEGAQMLNRLSAVRQAVIAGDVQLLITHLTSLLGWGRGLTPSGDDVIVGLLLWWARALKTVWLGDSLRRQTQTDIAAMLQQVSSAIVMEAWRQTTAISANLIECAATGQGDERLIAVVDGIATGSASIAECVAGVLNWGSSSGIDALAGMALAVM